MFQLMWNSAATNQPIVLISVVLCLAVRIGGKLAASAGAFVWAGILYQKLVDMMMKAEFWKHAWHILFPR